ncbi:uncharacterized protein N7506_001526 [Penicillium brevicompactum]|uniref:uncharacterized protein n=1 Tax=Penicillium brevicompactum TaxID=5074 RepID=UPI0025416858|nr:uncharacterized protein N7506_001526 [Penicillium brevicompactum]KAJ5348273.1 hypothetical protein N7506_001526 [Penicillium brevicompactum]
MRWSNFAAVAASFGAASAGVIQARNPENTCSNSLFTGEILHLSLNIVEYPVVVDVELEENAIVTIDSTILIECTNAPTHLHTTVLATSTSTLTKTISTATVTATAAVGTSETTEGGQGISTVVVPVTSSGSSSGSSDLSGSSGNNHVDNDHSVATHIGTKTEPSTQESRTTKAVVDATSVSHSVAPVAGGNAVGSGINTNLYTASTSNTAVRTIVTTASSALGHKTTKTYTTTMASVTATISRGDWTDWTKYKANGVNLGGWLEQEQVLTNIGGTNTPPRRSTNGHSCGSVLEERYATFVTTADIDKLAAVGVNTLRIPTTYAAWVTVPGSALYHGNQKDYLQKISVYAIEKYNMRVIVGLHSLPGGVNSLDIGEKSGNDGWFFNTTNLGYSLQAVDQVLNFFVETGYPWAFTISHINEASDNPSAFASPNTLTTNGTNWIVKYTQGVLSRIARVDKRIPLMLQDCFLGEEHWSPLFPTGTNLVIDTHVYYFAASGVYSQWANGAICGQASVVGGDGKFPVFVGEWALQTLYSNKFANRKNLFDTQRYAWSFYAQGDSFWNIKHNSSAAVDGQGTQKDYWSYEGLIDAGVIHSVNTTASYC